MTSVIRAIELAITFVVTGRATVAEAARLAGISRQGLHKACQHHPAVQQPSLGKDGKPLLNLSGQPMTYHDIPGVRTRRLQRPWDAALARGAEPGTS